MLDSLRIRNFRSFSSSELNSYIDIKPLTVLLGKNSSGKSSFLRTFPLLRQSVEKDTTGPILWYGSYVDFGAFSEVKNNDLDDDKIHFDFKLDLNLDEYHRYARFGYRTIRKEQPNEYLKVEVEISVAEENKKTVASSVKIKIDEEEFTFEFHKQDKGICKFNGTETSISHVAGRNFIPNIGRVIDKKYLFKGKETIYRSFDEEFLSEFMFKDSLPILKQYFHSNTSTDRIRDGLERIGVCSKDSIKAYLNLTYSDNKVFIKNLESNPKVVIDFYKVIIRYHIRDILRMINQDLDSVFNNVRYIAPLRATAERYYRHQDLQVNEIDHTGSNLAMLLRSLSEKQQRSFSKWTKENFGFSIRVEELGLHYALKIKNKHDKHEYNINDMGFGFSQILPIVASIWFESHSAQASRSRLRRKQQIIFTIEQPELHLHPEYQAYLAKLFAKVVNVNNKSNSKIAIIFETHSRTMINTLGDCIEDGDIAKEDINIVLFEKGADKTFTNVSFSKYDEEGDLLNWPIGFFSGR